MSRFVDQGIWKLLVEAHYWYHPSMADIKIYTKPTCPYCAAAKADMDGRGIAYDEIDVVADTTALSEMERLSGGRTVPVIVEGDNVTVGFGGG